MDKRIKISVNIYPEIINAYTKDLIPMSVIAKSYGITRMGVWKILHKNNINTTKAIASNIPTKCSWCQKPITVKRCLYRNSLHHFCSTTHYFSWLNRPITPFIRHRHSIRIAKKIIEQYYQFLPENVVHHEDRNQTNNNISNLRVFSSNSDHIKYHRGLNISPIWDGRTITQQLNIK